MGRQPGIDLLEVVDPAVRWDDSGWGLRAEDDFTQTTGPGYDTGPAQPIRSLPSPAPATTRRRS